MRMSTEAIKCCTDLEVWRKVIRQAVVSQIRSCISYCRKLSV